MIPVSMVVYWMMISWLKKVIPVSMVVYWMMIFLLKQSDTCVNSGLLNDDIFIKTKWYLCQWWFIEWWYLIKTKWFLTNVSIVVYWMMIFWLKQSDTWKIKQSDTCVNGGLLNDDTLIKTKCYREIKTKWYLCQ